MDEYLQVSCSDIRKNDISSHQLAQHDWLFVVIEYLLACGIPVFMHCWLDKKPHSVFWCHFSHMIKTTSKQKDENSIEKDSAT